MSAAGMSHMLLHNGIKLSIAERQLCCLVMSSVNAGRATPGHWISGSDACWLLVVASNLHVGEQAH